MENLRRNRDEAHRVAWKLLDSKRQDLKAGAPGKDILSLLGLLLPLFSVDVVVKDLFPSEIQRFPASGLQVGR